MAFERKPLGLPYVYQGRSIVLRIMQPDLIAEVDGIQVGQFWRDFEAGLAAGKRHVDEEVKEEEKLKAAKAARRKK